MEFSEVFMEFILLVHNKFDKSLDWYELSKNQNITLKEILKHSELPWDRTFLSDHKFSNV